MSHLPPDTGANSGSSEIEMLLALMADDQLSIEQEAQLIELVSGDAPSRAKYIEMVSLCANLEWACGGGFQAPLVSPSDADLCTVNFGSVTGRELPAIQANESLDDLRSPNKRSPKKRSPKKRSPKKATTFKAKIYTTLRNPFVTFVAGTLAASLLLAMLGLLRLPGDVDQPVKVAKETIQKSPDPSVDDNLASLPLQAATLSGLVDCQWAADSQAPTYGEPLHVNRALKLESGLAQLTFESGAKLILQGPAEFQIHSDMKGRLGFGKLTAVVPQQAYGFTVSTPSAEVVDLGTEFGIEVDEKGDTEVHVFTGEVISWNVDSRGKVKGKAVSLTQDASVAFKIGTRTSKNTRFEPSKFVREVSPRLTDNQLPPLPVNHNLALWLAADVLVKKDEQNGVVAWRDILLGDNQQEEDAWQHDQPKRPLWVADAIGGKPALRFDGKSTSLVTTPIPSTKDQTVFFVFQRVADSSDPNQRRQLINYNGPPFTLPDPSQPFRILQISDYNTSGRYKGFVYAGLGQERIAQVGYVEMKQPAANGQPLVLTYTYNTANNQSELHVDGESQGVGEAIAGEDFVSRKIIGKHPLYDGYFHGDIAEVLIYNTALASDDRENVTGYLGEKYSIPIQTQKHESGEAELP